MATRVCEFTHGLLRVMESVRTTDGNDGVFKLYWEFGARIHHDKETPFDPADALATVGLDVSHAAAFDDESWDAVIRAAMDEGLALVGDDVGTPIIAFENSDGVKTGYFGPVISRIPTTEKSVAMWDALVTMMDVDSFFELKRTRTESPDPGDRPPADPSHVCVAFRVTRRHRDPHANEGVLTRRSVGAGGEQTSLECGFVDRPDHPDVRVGAAVAPVGNGAAAGRAVEADHQPLVGRFGDDRVVEGDGHGDRIGEVEAGEAGVEAVLLDVAVDVDGELPERSDGSELGLLVIGQHGEGRARCSSRSSSSRPGAANTTVAASGSAHTLYSPSASTLPTPSGEPAIRYGVTELREDVGGRVRVRRRRW